MDYMVMEFPDDVGEAQEREGRNIHQAERWLSMAGGVGLAVFGLSRRSGPGLFLAGLGALLFRRGLSGHCHTYELFGINTAGSGSDTRRTLGGSAGIMVEESVAVNRPLEDLYRFWRNLENLPRVMRHLQSVERVTETLSRWRASGPAGTEVEWTAEIINDVVNHVIGWRSLEGSDVVSAGSVHFDPEPFGRGTLIRVRLQVQPAGRQGRRRGGAAARTGCGDGDPGRPPALQAQHRGRRADAVAPPACPPRTSRLRGVPRRAERRVGIARLSRFRDDGGHADLLPAGPRVHRPSG